MADNPLGISSAGSATDELLGFSSSVKKKSASEELRKFSTIRRRPKSAELIEVSRDTKPDDAARNLDLATELGLPPTLVEASPETAEEQSRRAATARLLDKARVTDQFLSEDPNPKIAHDSVESLTFIEGLGNSLIRSWQGMKQGVAQFQAESQLEDILDSNRTYGEILESSMDPEGPGIPRITDQLGALYRYATSRIFEPDKKAYMASQAKIGDILDERAKTPMSDGARQFMHRVEESEGFLNTLTTIVSDPLGLQAFAAEVGLEFVPQLLVAGGVTATTRNPQAGAVTMGLLSGATERYRSPADFLVAAGVDLTDPGQVEALLVNPQLMKEAQEFGFTRGAIIGAIDAISGGIAGKALAKNPVADLLLQTAVQGAMGGTGEGLAQLATTGELDANEIIFEALGEFATAPIEVATVGGRPLVTRIRDMGDSARAESAVEGLEQIATALQESPLTERSPDTAADHMARVFGANDIEEFFLSAEALNAMEGVDIEELTASLGVDEQMADATMYGGDVRINAQEFSRHILMNPEVFAQLKDHVRTDPDGITTAESQEVDQETDLRIEEATQQVVADQEVLEAEEVGTRVPRTGEALSREQRAAQVLASLPEPAASPEVETAVQIAEHEAGVAALFDTAKDAGFTEAQYASYIESIKAGREAARVRAETRKLRREKKRTEKQYVEAREGLRQEVQESISQQPLYAALLSIGVDRLSYSDVLEAMQGDAKAMARLPKVNGRRIYTPKGQKGLSLEQYADVHGFAGGDMMLWAMLDQPTYEQAIESELTRRVEEKFPTVVSMRVQIEEAMQALHEVDNFGAILTFELARLRQMRGKKRINRSIIQARAKAILGNYRVGNINPRQLEVLQRREARRARKAIREGDLDTAAKHKLNQVVAYEMARESYKIKNELARGNKFMAKHRVGRPRKKGKQSGIPIDHKEKIEAILDSFQFGSQRAGSRRLQRAVDEPAVAREPEESLKQWMARKREEEGIVMHLGDTVIEADGKTHWKNLTLAEWRELKNSVGEIVKEGQRVNKLRSQIEGQGVSQIVEEIATGLAANISRRAPRQANQVTEVTDIPYITTVASNIVDTFENSRLNVAHLLLNTDSLLRAIDGFESLGTAYTFIKGGIDRAWSEGYMPHQVGYAARMKAESQKLNALFDILSKKEQNNLRKERDLPDVGARLTGFKRIGVLLNMGNAENIKALTDSGQFTELELQAIVNNASKSELDFVQGVWDFLAEFQDEVKDTVRRRQNRNPVMVEAQALQTPHGTLRGGYFPLHYDTEVSLRDKVVERFDFEESRDMMLRGGFAVGHTQDGHTQTRSGSGGRAVKLDPFVLQQHTQQLIYDLEMGDAVHDSFKVLHHKEMKKAFSDLGKPQIWQALDLWLGDTITGEMHRGGWVESGLRHVRTGTTVTALAFNVTTAALQPLGLLQTSTLIGKRNMLMGLYDLVGWGKGTDPYHMYQWVSSQSGFMAQREQSFNKDVHDAQHGLVNGFLKRVTPGKTADYVADTYFYFIVKAQRFVDVATWLGAKRQGLKMFAGDEVKSTLHADRMVARSQGSGIFHERTNVERGTISPAIRNTETIRVWSLFLSYFAAKMNVAWERTKKADFRANPIEIINYPVDMALLFFVEGALAAIIREGFQYDEEEDDIAGMVLHEGVKTAATGLPFIREAMTASEGFATGGALGSFATAVAKLKEQVSQGEMDMALFKATTRVLGVLFKLPSSQVNKTGQAWWEDTPFNDVEWWEYLTGPRKED